MGESSNSAALTLYSNAIGKSIHTTKCCQINHNSLILGVVRSGSQPHKPLSRHYLVRSSVMERTHDKARTMSDKETSDMFVMEFKYEKNCDGHRLHFYTFTLILQLLY